MQNQSVTGEVQTGDRGLAAYRKAVEAVSRMTDRDMNSVIARDRASRRDCPFLPGYEPRPIYLGEGISWTPSVRTAQSLWLHEGRRIARRSRPQIGEVL